MILVEVLPTKEDIWNELSRLKTKKLQVGDYESAFWEGATFCMEKILENINKKLIYSTKCNEPDQVKK
jgi:hypothetical protein